MSNVKTGSGQWEAKNKVNTIRLGWWTGAWLMSTALLAFGPKLIWHFEPLASGLAVIVNLALGLGMIVATIRHLKGLDEMHQKIFLEAAGLSLGVGLVAGNCYELLEDIKIISFEPEVSHLILLMGFTFVIGMIVGHRRYQ